MQNSEYPFESTSYQQYTLPKQDSFSATLIYFNKENLNGRTYSKDWFNEMTVMYGYETSSKEKMTNLESLSRKANEGFLCGEFGYPDSFDVSLSNVSHTIKNIRIEKDELVGDITILDTPKGKVLKSFIEAGCEMVFRPRSTGILEDGYVKIKQIFTFDAISSKDDEFSSIAGDQEFKIQDCL
jgi:hypothetical protein